MSEPVWVVVMGVSGCGKSHVGALVAQRLGLPLVEGDEFHSDENRALMKAGTPLDDAHRIGWLDTLGRQLQSRPGGAVLTCSALKMAYRDRLRAAVPGLRFGWLALDQASALARVGQRSSHFFPATLVVTQFETLESPEGEPRVLRLDALEPPEVIVDRLVRWVGQARSKPA